MRRIALLWVIISIVFSCAVPSGTVFGIDSSSSTSAIVISQLYIGNASQPRLVELYNNSDQAIDMTGWCVHYHASGTPSDTASERNCIRVNDSLYRAILPARAHVAFLQDSLIGGLGTGASGRVYVMNAINEVVDIVSWNTAPTTTDFPMPTTAAERPRILERKVTTPGVYQDTDKNGDDMFASNLRSQYETDSIVEEPDYCRNMSGLQSAIPEGFEQGEGYTCTEAVRYCNNMPGVRIDALPDTIEVDDTGSCYEDACFNLPEFQDIVPVGFTVSNENKCTLTVLPLQITELLPNPSGADDGHEFIELYNPNDSAVDLVWWYFYVNGDYGKQYGFTPGVAIGPKSYYVYTTPFSLTNTSGSMRLRSIDDQYILDVPEWINAKDDHSWAIIEGEWQYTTVPTPGAENIATPSETSGEVVVTLADCGEGRERNPATGRCRNIPVASTLKPCAEGQYRSEETNRCRSIVLSVASILKPCADGQFRNPETNRCKKIVSDEDLALADCGEGRERNPETNRCRNVLGVSTESASLPFPVEETPEGVEQFVGWWVLGGVVALGVGYAAWEWRIELMGMSRRVSRFVTGRK